MKLIFLGSGPDSRETTSGLTAQILLVNEKQVFFGDPHARSFELRDVVGFSVTTDPVSVEVIFRTADRLLFVERPLA
jgi:hypothetical protein